MSRKGPRWYVAKGFRKIRPHEKSTDGCRERYRRRVSYRHRYGASQLLGADGIVHVVANGYRGRASQMLLY
jgi:hypothetical protein